MIQGMAWRWQGTKPFLEVRQFYYSQFSEIKVMRASKHYMGEKFVTSGRTLIAFIPDSSFIRDL